MKEVKSKLPLLAWATYDWANSAFSAIIETFIFPAYFITSVAASSPYKESLWGLAIALSGLAVAITGPILGAIADAGGRRKSWLAIFTFLCVAATAGFWFILPDPAYIIPGLALIAFASATSEIAYIFYNAMLPQLAKKDEIGLWSGWGWAFGYAGGVISLLLCLLPLSLSGGSTDAARASFLICAAWYGLFALPIFLLTPADTRPTAPLVKQTRSTFTKIASALKEIRHYPNLVLFLVARMLFNDALITLFAFGGVLAASLFQLEGPTIITFAIGMNIAAGIGAATFAFIDERIGARKTILAALIGILAFGTLALVAPTAPLFILFALILGLFIGPAQASARSYLARMAPEEKRNEMFGFFALSAKVSAFLGPLLVSAITFLTGSLRLGMLAILLLICLGLALMKWVDEDRKSADL